MKLCKSAGFLSCNPFSEIIIPCTYHISDNRLIYYILSNLSIAININFLGELLFFIALISVNLFLQSFIYLQQPVKSSHENVISFERSAL